MKTSGILIRTLAAVSVIASSLVLAQAVPAYAVPGSRLAAQASDRDNCGTFIFDDAYVVSKTEDGIQKKTLVVSGVAPMAGISVTLRPLTYVRQPEYWGIEVWACSPVIGLPVMTPFTVTLDITKTVGTKGVEVIGALSTKKIPVS
jgi:hypothetical protein